jgi:ferritin-like metal-binding protein YciE
MNKTADEGELLLVAIQDLHAGEMAWQARLPAMRGKTGAVLGNAIDAECRRAAEQAAKLADIAERLGGSPQGAPNIWLNAVLDDAERDVATIEAGPPRDIAVVGALRKGKQSERVSYETAMGLASKLGEAEIARELTQIRDEEGAADAELNAILARLLA